MLYLIQGNSNMCFCGRRVRMDECKKMLVDYEELMSQAEGQGTEGKE